MMVVLGCYLLPLVILLGFPVAYLEAGGRRKGLLPATLCAALAGYGCFAFFAQGGGLKFVGESFEWPMVTTAGAVENARGQRFVPLTAAGRIQVYDSEGEFVRGWFIPASGGGFKLHVTTSDHLEVFTVRGDRRLVYAAEGTLLSDDHYREDYAQLPTGPVCRVDRRGAWYLWPLAHPWLAMLPSFAGLGGLMVLFNSAKLRTLRPIHRRSPTMVASDEFGQFSFAVDLMQGPPYAVIDSDHPRKLDSPTGL